jgi:hypothetical protein
MTSEREVRGRLTESADDEFNATRWRRPRCAPSAALAALRLEDIGRRIAQIHRLHKLVGLHDRSPTLLTAVTGLVTSHGRQSPASRDWELAVEGGKTSRSASVPRSATRSPIHGQHRCSPGAVQTAVALTSSAAGPFGGGSCGTCGCCPIAARGIVRLESTTAVGWCRAQKPRFSASHLPPPNNGLNGSVTS